MILTTDFTSIPRLLKSEFRLPGEHFLPTTPPRGRGEPDHSLPDHDFQPSYRTPDCVSALGDAFQHPLAGLFAPGLAP
jgi:hypothetical protein